ncbi:Sensor histidine kinase ResE [Thalassocella blandensis]|nr:Sensor histidine kinase ResE [Thalassocella blandensis]
MSTSRLFTLHSTLHGRLTLALFFSFLLVGIFTAILLIGSSRAYQQEVTQIMHRDLANHIVKEYLLFIDGEPQLDQVKHTFHNLMVLGPNFEFYLLDTQGNIVAYSADPSLIQRNKVSLAPLQQFIEYQDRPFESTIYADDPRDVDGKKIFSAAPVFHNQQQQGYLLVILGSQIYDQISDGRWSSRIIQWGLWIFISGLIFSLLATLWLLGLLTRPLTRLTRQVEKVQTLGFTRQPIEQEKILADFARWQTHNPDEIHILGQAFQQALLKLNEQYQTIVSIDELRKELLSHISHDLRSPLASLLGYLETWEINHAHIPASESAEYIAIAKRNAQKISTLIEQLFELAHLDSGNVQVNLERIAIAELVEDVLQKFRIEAQERNIQLTVVPRDGRIKAYGDMEKLDRVFTNLIENALRHTKEGGSITVNLSEQGRLVSVEVLDTGIGIPEEDLPYIFNPHYKAGNSVRENTAHGGLGLAITKKLLDLHHSSITVSSKINQGTKFEFALSCQM